MANISKIIEEQENKISTMFTELEIFFAFSNEQFKNGKKEGVTYVKYLSGMLVPKENVDRLNDELKRINYETQQCFQQQISMNKYIRYELINHEVFYTGDTASILGLVQLYYPNCTIEDIQKIYLKVLKSNPNL